MKPFTLAALIAIPAVVAVALALTPPATPPAAPQAESVVLPEIVVTAPRPSLADAPVVLQEIVVIGRPPGTEAVAAGKVDAASS